MLSSLPAEIGALPNLGTFDLHSNKVARRSFRSNDFLSTLVCHLFAINKFDHDIFFLYHLEFYPWIFMGNASQFDQTLSWILKLNK